MRVPAEGLGNDPFEPGLDFIDILSGRETGAIADTEDVRVDREGFLAEGRIENDIGCLPSDAGEGLQLLPSARYLAAILVDQHLAEGDHVLRLGIEQPDGLDRLAQALLAEINHLAGSLNAFEKRPGGDVDAGVGRLG